MLSPGDDFDRYTIESLLGEGGMGVVYRARDTKLGRSVALKILRVSPAQSDAQQADAGARLLREARAAAALSHPNAVSVFDVGEHEGAPFIAMELVSGRSLREALADPSVPGPRRLRWMVDIARALEAAHEAGIVHRDVKPENVLVRKDGSVKVLDFGIARRSSVAVDTTAPTQSPALPTLTVQGLIVGTPLYMAPEQIRGDAVDGRADQFTWGVVAYEALGGRIPWRSQAEPLALAASILTDVPEPLLRLSPTMPPEVAAVVERALQKRPDDRFASMGEVVSALEPYLVSPSLPPSTPRQASLPPPPAVRPSVTPRAAEGPGATDLRRYSNEQLQAVIERALERQRDAPPTGIGHAELLEVARELGVDERAVSAAARELAATDKAAQELAAERPRAKRKLLRNTATFGVLILFLVVAFHAWWIQWVVYGWGLTLAMQAVNYGLPREPKRRRDEARKRRTPAFERAVEEGASALLTATETRARLRVPAVPEAAHGTAEAEREALAEAEQASQADAKRRRARS